MLRRLLRGSVDWNYLSGVQRQWRLASPPSRRRGLKLGSDRAEYDINESPPSRRRGLKPASGPPETAAWTGRLLRGGVDWNRGFSIPKMSYVRRLLRGGVDWNMQSCISRTAIVVASFAEAWIEICKGEIPFQGHSPPPPSRRCGLKYLIVHPTN